MVSRSDCHPHSMLQGIGYASNATGITRKRWKAMEIDEAETNKRLSALKSEV